MENSEVATTEFEIINISDNENAVFTGSCSVNTDDNITDYGNDSSLSTKDANPESSNESLSGESDFQVQLLHDDTKVWYDNPDSPVFLSITHTASGNHDIHDDTQER